MIHFCRSAFFALCSLPCPVCGQTPPQACQTAHNRICDACMEKLTRFEKPYCPGCGGSLDTALDLCTSCLRQPKRPWNQALSCFKHDGEMRILIHRMKYRNRPDIAETLGHMAALMHKEALRDIDYITYVPLHMLRYIRREYNQAQLIAETIAKEQHIPCIGTLWRTHYTREQMTLGRDQRRRNIRQVFAPKRFANKVKGKHVLLVDDVFTTGATLHGACLALQKLEPAKITVLTAARR